MILIFHDELGFKLNPFCIYMLVRADNKQYKERFMKLKDDEQMTCHGLLSFHAIDVSDPGPYGYVGMSKDAEAYKEVSQIDFLAQSYFGGSYPHYSTMKISWSNIDSFDKEMRAFIRHHTLRLEHSCYIVLGFILKDQRIKNDVDKLIDKWFEEEESDILKAKFTQENLSKSAHVCCSSPDRDPYTGTIRNMVTPVFLMALYKYIAKLLSPDIQKSNAEIKSFFRKRAKYTADCLLDDRGEMLPEPRGEIVIKQIMTDLGVGHDIVLRIDGEEIRLDNMSKREKLYYAFVCLMSPEGVYGYGKTWKPMKSNKFATQIFAEKWKRFAGENRYYFADEFVDGYSPQTVSNINHAIRMAVGDKDYPEFYEISRADDKHYVKMPRERIDTADFFKSDFK